MSRPVKSPAVTDTAEAESSSDGSSTADEEAESDEDDASSPPPADDEWITAENFSEKARSNFGLGAGFAGANELLDDSSNQPPLVACLTTDFAVQNVLFHCGLQLINMHGYRIKELRNFVLWCGTCFRPTKRTDTYFCPSCGYPNLRRIPVTVHEDGQVEFHFSRRYVPNRRGLKQPIVKPKGGKHADNPIYCADQRLPDRRPAQSKHPNVQPITTNGLLEELGDDWDPVLFGDYSAFPLHDITSRAARLGIRADGQIGPSAWSSHFGTEHGLRPTRGRAHLTKRRTGNKKSKGK